MELEPAAQKIPPEQVPVKEELEEVETRSRRGGILVGGGIAVDALHVVKADLHPEDSRCRQPRQLADEAFDVPSGFDPNTGKTQGDKCIKADATITFHRLKVGLANGRKYTGPVRVEWIGIPPEAEKGIV